MKTRLLPWLDRQRRSGRGRAFVALLFATATVIGVLVALIGYYVDHDPAEWLIGAGVAVWAAIVVLALTDSRRRWG